MDQTAISASMQDTVPAKYRDPKTGKIKGSFRIDIDGDMASFKDIKSKKELFKVPLSELAGPANKVIKVQGYPLDMSKKVMFISGDSSSKSEFVVIGDGNSMPPIPPIPPLPPLPPLEPGKPGASRILVNGREIAPADLDKIDPSSIKTIDIRGAEEGVNVTGKNKNGMTWTEATSADGKKIVTIKVDSVMFDGVAKVAVPTQGKVSNIHISVDTSDVVTVTGFKKKSNVGATIVRASDDKVVEKAKTDPNEPITVTGYKKNSNVSTITFRTTDDKVVEGAKKDPKTLTVTTTDKDGKKTITYVQKHEEKTELPKDVLYIVDGKELQSGSMKDIDPNSIKSINVLKGETAAKLYGEKGKNGIIEIITKKKLIHDRINAFLGNEVMIFKVY
jgi:hypothetical protein